MKEKNKSKPVGVVDTMRRSSFANGTLLRMIIADTFWRHEVKVPMKIALAATKERIHGTLADVLEANDTQKNHLLPDNGMTQSFDAWPMAAWFVRCQPGTEHYRAIDIGFIFHSMQWKMVAK